MPFFKKLNGSVCFFDTKEEAVIFGESGLIQMTAEEIEAHLNPPKTDEQIYAEWKAQRQALVDAIEVEYNGVIYQGDEISQGRMTRPISCLPDDVTTTEWTAKDNTVHALTRLDLIAILQMAGSQQTAIWNVGRPNGE